MIKNSKSGFTLLEVLIALTILAVLAIFTGDSVRRSLQMKAKIQKDVTAESKIRNAVKIFERDVNMAFHYRNIDFELRKAMLAALAASGASQAGGAPQPGPTGNDDDKEPVNLTKFMGEDKMLNLTTLSHVRLAPNSKESDQEEVGYYVEACPSNYFFSSDDKPGDCLYRRSSPYIDDDVEKGGNPVPLISGVKKFNLRYLGPGKQDWVSQWKSDDTGDDVARDNFPYAVELDLVIEANGKELSFNTVVPLRFPNNTKKTTGGSAGTTKP